MIPVIAMVVVSWELAAPSTAAIPPAEPTGVTAEAAHEQVRLSWTLPADVDIQQIIVRRTLGLTPPADPTTGDAVYSGMGTTVRDTGLTNATTYTYRLWSVAAGPSYSTPVTIVATPVERIATGLSMQVDRNRLDFGEQVTMNARLVDSDTALPLSDERVELQARIGGGQAWRTLDQQTSSATGRAQWTRRLDASSQFRVIHLATAFYARSVGPVRQVQLTPLLTARLGKDWVRQTGRAIIHGRVRPGFRDGLVVLERRTDSGWRSVAKVRQNRRGEYAFHVGGWADRGTIRYRVLLPENAKHRRVTSAAMVLDVVRVVTYQIETRGRIVASLDTFKTRVAEIYADPRGWSRADVRFVRVKKGADFSVVLSQARLVASFAPICDTYYSCRVGRYVVINQDRWRFGTPYFKSVGGTMAQYRAMVIDHETGHWFGLGHATCSKRGAPAPVMMQQSKGLFGCKPNPWPLPGEIAAVR